MLALAPRLHRLHPGPHTLGTFESCAHEKRNETHTVLVLQALDYFERALNLCQEMGDARGEAATLRLLGFVHLAQVDGDRSISLSLFRKSLSLSKKNHDLLGQVATRLSLR